MTTVLRVNIHDLTAQFFQDLDGKLPRSTEVEIRIPDKKRGQALFSEAQFWDVIDALDWSQETSAAILAPAAQKLSAMPLASIYLFADQLSERLFQLDTRPHGDAYLAHEGDGYLSVDDFLYARCAVVAEGKAFFEKVLAMPAAFPADIRFEALLHLPDDAYQLKTGREFDYSPAFNYETFSNKKGWE